MKALAYLMIPGPGVTALVATLVASGRGEVSEPAWVRTVMLGVVVYVFVGLASIFVMRRQFAGPRGDLVRAKGRDPNEFLLLGGTCILYLPACAGLLLTPFGLEIVYVYIASAFSTVAILSWLVWYRPISGAHGQAEQRRV
jgi:hypothetical protein